MSGGSGGMILSGSCLIIISPGVGVGGCKYLMKTFCFKSNFLFDFFSAGFRNLP